VQCWGLEGKWANLSSSTVGSQQIMLKTEKLRKHQLQALSANEFTSGKGEMQLD
jgi:hypothetical protein